MSAKRLTELEEARPKLPPSPPTFAPLRHNRRSDGSGPDKSSRVSAPNVMLLAYPLLILDLTHSAVIAERCRTARTVVDFIFRLPAARWPIAWTAAGR